MHVLKERYVKKCGKDICGSELYTLVSFILLKTQYFFRIFFAFRLIFNTLYVTTVLHKSNTESTNQRFKCSNKRNIAFRDIV